MYVFQMGLKWEGEGVKAKAGDQDLDEPDRVIKENQHGEINPVFISVACRQGSYS